MSSISAGGFEPGLSRKDKLWLLHLLATPPKAIVKAKNASKLLLCDPLGVKYPAHPKLGYSNANRYPSWHVNLLLAYSTVSAPLAWSWSSYISVNEWNIISALFADSDHSLFYLYKAMNARWKQGWGQFLQAWFTRSKRPLTSVPSRVLTALSAPAESAKSTKLKPIERSVSRPYTILTSETRPAGLEWWPMSSPVHW